MAATGLGDLQSPLGMLEIVEMAYHEDLFAFRPHSIPTQDEVEPADPPAAERGTLAEEHTGSWQCRG